MRNNEPAWSDTRWRIDHTLDSALLLPPGLYLLGLFNGDAETLGIAIFGWFLAALIWTPWIIVRHAMNKPTGDVARATAMLGLGLLPWAACPFGLDWVEQPLGLRISFLIVFLPGAAAMALAAYPRPRRLAGDARRALLVGGGVAWGVFALLLAATLAFGLPEAMGPFTAVPVLLAGLSGVAAAAVLRAAARPSPPPASEARPALAS